MKEEEVIQEKIKESRSKITQLTTEVDQLCVSAHGALVELEGKVYGGIDRELYEVNREAYEAGRKDAEMPLTWDSDAWKDYKPVTTLNKETLPDRLQVGMWYEDHGTGVEDEDEDEDEDGQEADETEDESTDGAENEGEYEFRLPAYVSWFHRQKTLIIKTNNQIYNGKDKIYDQGLGLVRSLIQRIHCLIPHYSQFTLLDPVSNGAAFPMKRNVITRDNDSDLYHVLEEVIADSSRIIPIYALSENDYFSMKVDSITMNEKYEFVVAANFPKGYESRVIEKMVNIGNTGYIAGKYLIVLYNEDEPLPRDFSLDKFEDAEILDLTQNIAYETETDNFWMDPSEAAEKEEWQLIVDRLKDFKPVERKITWQDHIAIADSSWISGLASRTATTVPTVCWQLRREPGSRISIMR